MSKAVGQELKTLKKAINKDVGIPFIGSILDRKRRPTAATKSSKADVASEELIERRRRILKEARKRSFPLLEKSLEANPYREIIAKLTGELLEDQAIFGEGDALYVMELALELSRIDDGRPAHQFLLNAIQRNADTFGSLDHLRELECPGVLDQLDHLKTVTTFITRSKLPGSHVDETVQRELLGVMKAGKVPPEALGVPADTRPGKTDSQLIREKEPYDLGKKLATPSKDNEDAAKFIVLRQWYRLEETVRHRVSALRGEDVAKHVKDELKERQEWMETVLDLTRQSTEDDAEREVFDGILQNALPEFRSKMNWKITKYPEIAARVYDILDSLIELQVPANEFVNAAVLLASANSSRVILEISQAIAFESYGEDAADYIIKTLKESDKTDDLASRGKTGQLPTSFVARKERL